MLKTLVTALFLASFAVTSATVAQQPSPTPDPKLPPMPSMENPDTGDMAKPPATKPPAPTRPAAPEQPRAPSHPKQKPPVKAKPEPKAAKGGKAAKAKSKRTKPARTKASIKKPRQKGRTSAPHKNH